MATIEWPSRAAGSSEPTAVVCSHVLRCRSYRCTSLYTVGTSWLAPPKTASSELSSRHDEWPLRAGGGVPDGLSARQLSVAKSNSYRSSSGRLESSAPPKTSMPSGSPTCSTSGTTVAVCSVRAGGSTDVLLYTIASQRGVVVVPLPRWRRCMSLNRVRDALSPPKR